MVSIVTQVCLLVLKCLKLTLFLALGSKRSKGDFCKDKYDRKHLHVCKFEDKDGKMCASKDHGQSGH